VLPLETGWNNTLNNKETRKTTWEIVQTIVG
jgi:hypothetical protein